VYYPYTNILEMRKPNLTKINDTLYEIVHALKSDKLKAELDSDGIELLKKCFNAEHIFKNTQTNEYIFVNKIEELETIND
jgi:hypothetical protein